MRSRYGIGQHVHLSLNDIHPRKNLEGLVEAFGRLKLRSGLTSSACDRRAKPVAIPGVLSPRANNQFADDIRVLGYVPSEDVLALYQGADCSFILRSMKDGACRFTKR